MTYNVFSGMLNAAESTISQY